MLFADPRFETLVPGRPAPVVDGLDLNLVSEVRACGCTTDGCDRRISRARATLNLNCGLVSDSGVLETLGVLGVVGESSKLNRPSESRV